MVAAAGCGDGMLWQVQDTLNGYVQVDEITTDKIDQYIVPVIVIVPCLPL